MPNINLQRADPNAAAQTAVRPNVSGGPSHKLAILEGMSRALGAQGEARQRLAYAIMGFGRAIAENGQKIAGLKDDAAKKIIKAETESDLARFSLLLKKDYQDALQETQSKKYLDAESQCDEFSDNFRRRAEARINSFLSGDQIALAKGECFRYAQQLHITADDPTLRALVDSHIASGSEFFTKQWYQEQRALDQFTLNYELMDKQSSLVDALADAKTTEEVEDLIGQYQEIMFNIQKKYPQLGQNEDAYVVTADKYINQALLTAYSEGNERITTDEAIAGRVASALAVAQNNQQNRALQISFNQKRNEQRRIDNQRARRDENKAEDDKMLQEENQERKKEAQAKMAEQNSKAVQKGIDK